MPPRRFLVSLIGTLTVSAGLVGAPSDSAAQGGPSERAGGREEEAVALRASIKDELTRLSELRSEFDRREASLTEMLRRLDRLDGVATAAAAAPEPAATVAQTAAPAPEKARFEFYGDSTFRLATTEQAYSGCEICPTRYRGRLRLRFGIEGRLAPGLRVVTGLGMGELNDPNSIYQTLGSKMNRKVTTYDRAYLDYVPPRASWLGLTVGKFPYVWTRSSMTFDVDLYPEGLSQRASLRFKRESGVKNVTVQALQMIVNEFPTARDTTILGGQTTAEFRMGPRLTTRPMFTYFDLRQPDSMLRGQLSGADVGTKNTNQVVFVGDVPFYASRFRYVNAIVENVVSTKSAAWPVVVALEYQKNIAAVSDRDTGTSVRIDAGRQQRKGDWFLSWHAFRVEQDAIVASLGESDWRAPSNVMQHRMAVVRTLHPSVFASWTLYRGRTLDSSLPGALLAPGLATGRREPWVNQMYFDIIYRY